MSKRRGGERNRSVGWEVLLGENKVENRGVLERYLCSVSSLSPITPHEARIVYTPYRNPCFSSTWTVCSRI